MTQRNIQTAVGGTQAFDIPHYTAAEVVAAEAVAAAVVTNTLAVGVVQTMSFAPALLVDFSVFLGVWENRLHLVN